MAAAPTGGTWPSTALQAEKKVAACLTMFSSMPTRHLNAAFSADRSAGFSDDEAEGGMVGMDTG